MCDVQPDYLSVLHTFLKHHSGFLTALLKGIFVETHKLRCPTVKLAIGPKVIPRGPMTHLLAKGPCKLCFHRKQAKKTKPFTSLDGNRLTGWENTHQQKTN